MFLEMNKMNDEDIIRVYPVIDDEPEKIYEKLESRRFGFEPLSENKLVPPGVGDMVLYEELDSLRQDTISLANKVFNFISILFTNFRSSIGTISINY